MCLLVEEGLFYFFEYEVKDGDVLGVYCMVIVDFNDVFVDNVQVSICFGCVDVIVMEDVIDCW